MAFDIKVFDEHTLFDYLVVNRPHHPEAPAFFIVKKGSLVFIENLHTITLTANSVYIIDPKKVYEILEVSKDIEIMAVAFAKNYVEKLPLKIDRVNVYVYLSNKRVRHFLPLPEKFSAMVITAELLQSNLSNPTSESHNEEISTHLFSALLYQFVQIVEAYSKSSTKQNSRKEEIVLTFLKEVEENYLNQRDITFYAGKLSITSRHLSAVLKEVAGKTAGQIISALLLREAKAMLSSTDKSIYEIASDLKFSDQYAFSHFFKKHVLETPTSYRRNFRI
ncbi:AraC family transcriptional regulator [Pontibacter sp. E15-1]|uniref:helix-turn-helix domain-containing protein n=1 Tax=Pontibacter sp. E15-1 TaxID=2919918 RepID=UPI001F4FF562|nr:AraC family transcriptional regulator [Pontibacter sp. E15-1]MCJ8165993.1 AraC family transcriptional regulator [Pontibacter sp. E15-1]